jgi:ABC-type amino acid transport substrate-binding protein
MRLEVNRALTQVYASGEIERVFNQWLGRLGKPTNLLAAMYLLYSIPE